MLNRFEIKESVTYVIIPCKGKGYIMSIDTRDLNKINKYPGMWIGIENNKSRKIYVRTFYKGGHIQLHRLLMKDPIGMVVDHIDRNTLNNRRCNLRVVSKSVNNQNKGMYSNSASGIKYVKKKGNLWEVMVKKNGRVVYNKCYKDLMEATMTAVHLHNLIFPSPLSNRVPIIK
jgi:hypothetical protein